MSKAHLMLTLWGWSLGAQAAPLRLDELQAKLRRSGAAWTAGETSLSRLSVDDRRRLLGAPIVPDDYFSSREPSPSRAPLPATLDWRNVDGVSYASPVLNQGRCGSCVAFAAIATLETQLNIARKTPASPWAYSPQHLFSCGGGGCNIGWQPSDAVRFLKSRGVPDEACFPYASGALGEDVACSKSCGDAAARSIKISGSTTPTSSFEDIEAVKQALQKGPLITVMSVYEDLYYYRAGVYHHTSGELAGGHAISIVGYSEPERAWIVRNSWGDDWGDEGYFKIAWGDDSGLARNTWGMQVAEAGAFVAIAHLSDRDVVRGETTLEIESTVAGSHVIEVTLSRGDVPLPWARPVAIRRGAGSVALDTTAHEDGVYTLVATAHKAGGNVASQPRIVYVLNGALTGSVALTNVTENQTLSKSYLLKIDTQASPVPFNALTFYARNVETGAQIMKSTINIAKKMALNWRMKDVPSGAYEIWAEASAGEGTIIRSGSFHVRLDNH